MSVMFKKKTVMENIEREISPTGRGEYFLFTKTNKKKVE